MYQWEHAGKDEAGREWIVSASLLQEIGRPTAKGWELAFKGSDVPTENHWELLGMQDQTMVFHYLIGPY